MPADKLVLGLPWYGYRYPCTNPAFAAGQEQLCALQPTPFQGAPCSDAAGAQLCYSDIAAAVRRGSGGSGSHAGNGGGSRGGGSASRSSNGKGSSSGSTSGQGGSSSNSNGGRQLAEGAVQPLPSHQPAAKQALQGDLLVCEPPEFDVGQQSPYTACRWEGDPPGTRRFQVGSCVRRSRCSASLYCRLQVVVACLLGRQLACAAGWQTPAFIRSHCLPLVAQLSPCTSLQSCLAASTPRPPSSLSLHYCRCGSTLPTAWQLSTNWQLSWACEVWASGTWIAWTITAQMPPAATKQARCGQPCECSLGQRRAAGGPPN